MKLTPEQICEAACDLTEDEFNIFVEKLSLIKKIFQNTQDKLDQEQKPWPQNGDEYYVITDDGIVSDPFIFGHYEHDIGAKLMGNFFRTAEEAERERDRRILIADMKRYRDKVTGGWRPEKNEQWFFIISCTEQPHWYTDASLNIARELWSLGLGPYQTEKQAESALEKFRCRMCVLLEE